MYDPAFLELAPILGTKSQDFLAQAPSNLNTLVILLWQCNAKSLEYPFKSHGPFKTILAIMTFKIGIALFAVGLYITV